MLYICRVNTIEKTGKMISAELASKLVNDVQLRSCCTQADESEADNDVKELKI